MTVITKPLEAARSSVSARKRGGGFQRLLVHIVLVGLMILWFVPTLGLLINSFRPAADVSGSGWWTSASAVWRLAACSRLAARWHPRRRARHRSLRLRRRATRAPD